MSHGDEGYVSGIFVNDRQLNSTMKRSSIEYLKFNLESVIIKDTERLG